MLFAWTKLHDYGDLKEARMKPELPFELKWTVKKRNTVLTSWNFLIDEEICFLLNRWSLHAKHGRIPQIWGRRVHQWPQQHLPLLVAAAVAAAAATLGQAVVLTALSLVHQCLLFLWRQLHRQLPCQVPDIKIVVSCCIVPWLCFSRD